MPASASRSRSAAGSSAVGSDALVSMIASRSLPLQLGGGEFASASVARERALHAQLHADRADDFFQADAGHQLHAEQPLVGGFVDLFGKHLDDVGVFEPGHRAAFAAAIGRDLERDFAIERNLAGEIDVAERPAAEHAHDFEVVDLRAGRERGRSPLAPHRRPGHETGRRRWAPERESSAPRRSSRRRA